MPFRELRKSDFVPYNVVRYFHVNSLGEFSVKDLQSKDPKKKPEFHSLDAEDLHDDEADVFNRTLRMQKEMGSAQFRVYAGISPEENGPWMTLESEFRWMKTEGGAKQIVEDYAKKFNGKLEQLFGHPEEEKADTFCVVVPIYGYTVNDAKVLKDKMVDTLKNSEELQALLVTVW